MNHSAHSIARRLIPGFSLGILVMFGLAWLGNLREVSQALLHFRFRYLMIALAFSLISEIFRFSKWRAYLYQIGVRGLPWIHSLRLYIASLLLTLASEKTSSVLKGVWLNRLCGVPVERGIFIDTADRLTNGLTLVIFVSLSLLFLPFNGLISAILVTLAIVILIISQIRPAALWLISWTEKIPSMQESATHVRELFQGPISLFSPFTMLWTYLLGSLSWFCKGIGFYYIFLGLGMAPGYYQMVMAIFIFALASVLGTLSGLPGGFGIVEAMTAGLITIILKQTPAFAVSATLLMRLTTIWFVISLGMITWTFSHDLVTMPASRENSVEVG